jgi:ABC-type sugar transport system permease subunit
MTNANCNNIARAKPKKAKINWSAYLWLLPTLILCGLFCLYPVIDAFVLSFTDSTIGSIGKFVGFQNFIELFSDEVFWICIKNVLIFTVTGLVCGNVMTIILAELLFNFKGKHIGNAFRVIFIIPAVVPFIVIVLIWRYIIFSTNGFANNLLAFFQGSSYQPVDWYFNIKTDMIAIILTNFPWVGGTSFLIYLAGLQGIPTEVYEAAKLDGCGTFRRLFQIDMPLIKPQLKYFLIMGVIGGLQNFDLQLIITGSGVGTSNSVNVPGYYLYEMAFLSDKTRFGYASAVGVILFILTMGFTIADFRNKKSEAGY